MRRYRKDIDISQDALADKVGVTTGAISQIERAVNKPRRETAEAIDRALDADGAILVAFGYTDPISPTSSTDVAARLDSVDARLSAIEADMKALLERAGQVVDLLGKVARSRQSAAGGRSPGPGRRVQTNHPGR